MARPARPKYQIFISSTFLDLEEERKAVTWAVLKAGHIPVGMENFSAANERGWRTIQRLIDTTDYYVLILAGRYGYIDEEWEISWTEKEFRYAMEKGIPVLAFVRHDSAITADKMEKDPRGIEKRAAFLKDVHSLRLVSRWKASDDLCAEVASAIHKLIQTDEDEDTMRPGWYRGDQISMSPQVAEEIARLSRERDKHRDEADKLRTELEKSQTKGEVKLRLILEDLGPDYPIEDGLVMPVDQFSFVPYSPPKPSLADEALGRHLGLLSMSDVLGNPYRGYDRKKIADYLDKKNRSVWLSLILKNEGTLASRELIVDLTVDGAEHVSLLDNPPVSSLAVRVPRMNPSLTNPQEHVYVDNRGPVSDTSCFIRQRVRLVSPGATENLIPVLLRAAPSVSTENGWMMTVAYAIHDSNGNTISGTCPIDIEKGEMLTIDEKKYKELFDS